ncbi:adenylate/guanylate cyclase domain-containing protein [Stigmatella aurantiaca]|uniref:Adenylate/guanylate cyclase domain protein n=1 Tax=Stigmatella aurantiaca (strain DW4/3-1) TaxID=378806 RepID=Q096T6_STIAD|nr:adenylate/guanylate cyclase domain-containing protein [Stigmatella aurantiaca]ADO68540.1 Adenylate/guanylate cyclase domain protein [Stigmatella aurantiaca DW4/3-1]EAU67744.1 adenylyl cyclase [Stigmatella aurantiaca DW4/3-1]
MVSDTRRILKLRLRNHLARMVGLALLATAVAAMSWQMGWLWMPNMERQMYDSALTTFTRRPGLSGDIVVVAIDQSTLDGIRSNRTYARNFGNYPWTRSLWARVAEELTAGGARAVMFDAVMDEPDTDPSADQAFAEALRATGLPFYLGVSSHPSAAPLPRVEPVQPLPAPPDSTPNPPAVPSVPAAPTDEFEEVEEEKVQPPADPLDSARALAFPVKTGGRALPQLEYEPRPGLVQHPHLVPPIAALLSEVDGFGLVEVEPDPDGSMRRTRFAYTDGTNAYVTLPVALAADLFGAAALEFSGRKMRLGSRELTVNADGSAEIDFGGTLHERYHVIPLLSVLDAWALRQEGQPTGLSPDLFRGKVVVIGGTALGVGDTKTTPFGATVPGMSKQVAVLDNLLAGRFITQAPFWVSLLFSLGLALASTVLLMTLRWPALELAWLLALIPGVFLVLGLLLSLDRVHLLVALPAVAGLLASLGAVASNHLLANREAAFIRQAFSRYMEPKLIEQMIEENQLPRLDGEEREITAFFSDIRGFSTFSERFREDPRALVRVLNMYLTRVSSSLLQEGGCLDKYIGDAVVCLFGAPINHTDHAVRACRGALRAKAEVEALRNDFRQQGLPDVYTRIGLNSAKLFVGNFGSEQLFDYTAIGDGMNLAARLEGANKAYGTLIMIGPNTYARAKDAIEVRELDNVRVAGKTEAVTVYELLALKGELTATTRETVARYHEALTLYRQARFAEAAAVLEKRLAQAPEDGPTAVLLARCRNFEKSPPHPFDGVTNLDK